MAGYKEHTAEARRWYGWEVKGIKGRLCDDDKNFYVLLETKKLLAYTIKQNKKQILIRKI